MQPAYNDCIFLHRRQVVADACLDIDTGGLVSVTCGGRPLEEGRDYAASESGLIFKAGFLLTLPCHPVGEVAVVRCEFSDRPAKEVRVFQLEIEKTEKEKTENPGGKPEEPARKPGTKRKILPLAIGGAGLIAAVAAGLVVSFKKSKPSRKGKT